MEYRTRVRTDENAISSNSSNYMKRAGNALKKPETKRVALRTVTNVQRAAAKAAAAKAVPAKKSASAYVYRETEAKKLKVSHEDNANDMEEDIFMKRSNTFTNSTTNNTPLGSDDTVIEEEDDNEMELDGYTKPLADLSGQSLDSAIAEAATEDEEEEEEEEEEAVPSVTNPNALYPQLDKKSQSYLAKLASEFRNKPGVFDEDDEDTYDVSMVAEYSDDIFVYMRKLETKMRPDPGYMDSQTEIHWSMRAILVDWLVQVHARFNLLPETLFLTVNYMDRFLSLKTVSLTKFQLVGAVALFLAAKYEEINCPSVKEIAFMVDNGYSVDEILRAERYMIDLLNFNLGWPGPMSFLRRTSKADDYDLETRTLAKYLLEISIMDERFVGAPPSWIAAASHCLSRRMLRRGEWSPEHVYFSGYTHEQLEPAMDALLQGCANPHKHHKAIFEKYSDKKFKRASLYVAEWMKEHSP